MILTVTPNVALDRTYVIDHLEVGSVHKVRSAFARVGGKGINVARVAAALGGEALVTGMIGAGAVDEATRELDEAHLRSELFVVPGSPRQTVTVTADDGTTTAFDEPGPTVTPQEWASFERHVAELLSGAELVVMAGSLPPGAPDQALERLCAAANNRGVRAIVDSRGAAMRAALNEQPLVAKLNRDELEQTLERELGNEDAVVEGALALLGAGARNVIVTLGADGAIGVGGDQIWRITHPHHSGNPIGAGDAFSAALALALLATAPFEQALRQGAAAALASLRAATAGSLDPADMAAALPSVHADRIAEVPAL